MVQKQTSDDELPGMWSHSDTSGGSTDCLTKSNESGSMTKMELADKIKELHAGAVNDAKMAKQNGVDLNPFSTLGARHLWQQGWDGIRPSNLTDGSPNWRYWERGGQARIVAQEFENASERPRG